MPQRSLIGCLWLYIFIPIWFAIVLTAGIAINPADMIARFPNIWFISVPNCGITENTPDIDSITKPAISVFAWTLRLYPSTRPITAITQDTHASSPRLKNAITGASTANAMPITATQ